MTNPLVRWREHRIARIERQVKRLNDQIDRAHRAEIKAADEDEMIAYAYAVVAGGLEQQRKALWLKRSELVKKQPPIYPEGATAP